MTITWEHLVKLEPRLLELEAATMGLRKAARRDPEWCANRAWDGAGHRWVVEGDSITMYPNPGIGERMSELVGWAAGAEAGHFKPGVVSLADLDDEDDEENEDDPIDPVLRTSDAYDVAFDHVYRLLPDCRGTHKG